MTHNATQRNTHKQEETQREHQKVNELLTERNEQHDKPSQKVYR